ncbi:uroporphyrin-III C-methyltransferase [Friedmanniella luteola]|uniref:uroporphyrinogen-III C-methyltransferase n=1 Tax=Friedmanniella luteola TaxID=546871 RepID=A0A1H1UN42_9ACTN|nr:uroporphyrinogen-III C-methyltransferase [Friedmanniella luteola]SDS73721.1 uroporphyrin-III C-methyltransferase [Friedmanniella luteola]
MQIDVDVSGRKVVVFGTLAGSRRVVRRWTAAGARVTVAVPGLLPAPTPRSDGVRVVPQPEPDDARGLLRLVGPAWSVVVVDVVPELAERVTALAGHLRLLVQHETPALAGGRVTLVGGGPGSTRLLTLEAVQALAEADAVLYDRLAPTDDLPALAPGAELVDVGKRPYHHPVSQHSIEVQLVARARAGQSVVRLKGGDAFVFGRGGEEMLACIEAGVPVRLVPGLSSALAVPAASGIPVTHRGLSHAFTVISGHVPPAAEELAALVRLGGTVVVLMGIANLEQIVAGLCAAGLDPAVPAAVVERGFSASQRSTFTTVGRLPAEVRRLDLGSPAVVVIGAVVDVAPAAGRTGELLAALDAVAPAGVRER